MLAINSQSQLQIIALDKWGKAFGRSPSTLWRWRKLGWLQTVNIAGKQYLTAEGLAEFHRRAESGEFSQIALVPQRTESTAKK